MNAYEFVNSLDSKQHIFQIITNDTNAKSSQFQFLNNGLLQNEYCVYLTHENPNKIKNQMRKFGIDVDRFEKNGLLNVHKAPDLLKHPDGSLVGFQRLFADVIPDPGRKFRFVGRAIKDLTTEKGWKAEMEIEQHVHSNFDKTNGMILCYYEYQKLGNSKTMARVMHVLNFHHSAIFSTLSEPNLAFNLDRNMSSH